VQKGEEGSRKGPPDGLAVAHTPLRTKRRTPKETPRDDLLNERMSDQGKKKESGRRKPGQLVGRERIKIFVNIGAFFLGKKGWGPSESRSGAAKGKNCSSARAADAVSPRNRGIGLDNIPSRELQKRGYPAGRSYEIRLRGTVHRMRDHTGVMKTQGGGSNSRAADFSYFYVCLAASRRRKTVHRFCPKGRKVSSWLLHRIGGGKKGRNPSPPRGKYDIFRQTATNSVRLRNS